MEVYQIRVFLEVARHLSFTEAAEALNLTQPAVSAKIKSLESELGVPLFYRLGRKIQLTEVGQFLLEEGVKLIQVENQLLQQIQEIKKGKSGQLRLGATGTIADGWLPEIIFTYRRAYPGIQTQCSTFDSPEALYRAIASQTVDLGFCDINFTEFSELSTRAISTLNYVAFVSATHPLAKQTWLSLQDLHKYPWVTLANPAPSRLMLESRLAELGLSLSDFSQVETVDTPALMRTYILQGNYLGFASDLDFKAEAETGMLVTLPLQEFAFPANVYLLTPRWVQESFEQQEQSSSRRSSISLNPVQKFLQLLQEWQTAKTPAPAPQLSPTRLRSPSFSLRTPGSQRPETLTLSIGIQNGTIPSITAGLIIQRLGLLEHFLPKEGRYSGTQYQIRWCDFSTGAPIVQELNAGQLNIGILGDYPLLLSALNPQAEASATRLVSFVSINPDGSCNALIVPHHSQVQSIEDFKGRVIAVPFSSSAHGMVLRSLSAANLLQQVQLTSLDKADLHNPQHLARLQADGYAHFAPFHDVACRRGAFRYLIDTSRESLPAFYGVVVSQTLADQHPEVVIAYLKALSAAQSWYDLTPSAPFLLSQWTRIETEIITQILSSSHQKVPLGRFVSDMIIRPDWLDCHRLTLSQIPGNEQLRQINLDRWIQPEFLQQLQVG